MGYSPASILKGGALFTAGSMATRACAFLLVPVFTHYLSPQDYGVVGYYATIRDLLTAVFLLGLHAAQIRYYHDFDENAPERGTFLFSTFVFPMAVFFPVCILASLWGQKAASAVLSPEMSGRPYLAVTLWSAYAFMAVQFVISHHTTAKRFHKAAAAQVVLFLVNAGASLLLVAVWRMGAFGRLLGVMAGSLAAAVLFIPGYFRSFRLRFDPGHVRTGLAFGLPLVFHLLAVSLHNSIDRVILERFVTLDRLGIYTLAYEAGLALSAITMSINQAWIPNFFELMKSGAPNRDREVKRVFAIWLLGVGSICIFGALWAREVLTLITPAAYAEAADIAPWVLAAYFFQGCYFFGAAPLFYEKKTRVIPMVTVFGAALNIVLNFMLIPGFGVVGAAWATTLSFAAQAGVVWRAGLKRYNPGFDSLKIACIIALAIGMTLAGPKAGTGPAAWAFKLVLSGLFAAITIALFREYFFPAFARAHTLLGGRTAGKETE